MWIFKECSWYMLLISKPTTKGMCFFVAYFWCAKSMDVAQSVEWKGQGFGPKIARTAQPKIIGVRSCNGSHHVFHKPMTPVFVYSYGMMCSTACHWGCLRRFCVQQGCLVLHAWQTAHHWSSGSHRKARWKSDVHRLDWRWRTFRRRGAKILEPDDIPCHSDTSGRGVSWILLQYD